MQIVIRPGRIVTGNPSRGILSRHSIVVEGNRIRDIVADEQGPIVTKDQVVDAPDLVAIPGFVQTHIHLCQTLFRGLADDLELLDWLQRKIFPFESAHNADSMYYSSMLGIAELVRSGTTTILDMGSVNHEEEVIRAVSETGLRAFVGKAMMDINGAYPALKEPTAASLKSTRDLAERWHNAENGRIKYAVAPRFVLSCTDSLLQSAFEMSASFDGMLFHTHASESRFELDEVRKRCKKDNIEFLDALGVLSHKTCLAHCVHISDREADILQKTNSNVVHCPSSNLKLGSGIADIPRLINKGICVSLGADGAPCNNNLDMFQEMRLASLLQKPAHGPTSMPADKVFEIATTGGARALGLAGEVGSIETGKKADIVLLDVSQVWNPVSGFDDIYSSIVYTCGPENVDSVMVDGRWLYRKKEFVSIDVGEIRRRASAELEKLLKRIR